MGHQHFNGLKTTVLLGGIFKLTGNQAPAIAFGNIKNKMPYEMLESQRFVKKHNLTQFKFNPNFPVNTLALMRMAMAAQVMGILHEERTLDCGAAPGGAASGAAAPG